MTQTYSLASKQYYCSEGSCWLCQMAHMHAQAAQPPTVAVKAGCSAANSP